jgi:hypothetical protein
MAQRLGIFVDTSDSLAAFVRELELLLGIEFQMASADDEIWYQFADPTIVLTVGEHPFENDHDLNFEDYRYDISVRPINYTTPEEWRARREDAAYSIFHKLMATQKYPLLLVDNLQIKLAEFVPAQVATTTPTI